MKAVSRLRFAIALQDAGVFDRCLRVLENQLE